MTTVTAQATEKWEGTPEEESLEASSENRHRGCGRDMLGQTVPSTASSNIAAGKARLSKALQP